MCNNTATATDLYLSPEETQVEFFITEFNVLFEDTTRKGWCHAEDRHGPDVETDHRLEHAEKNYSCFNFSFHETMLAARHCFCDTFRDEMRESLERGDKWFSREVECPDSLKDYLGETLYPDESTYERCSTIYGLYQNRDGVWYERTIYGKP